MNIVPRKLIQSLEPANIVQMQNLLLVNSCITAELIEGKSLNTAHQLLYLFSGEVLLQQNGNEYFANGGQAILIKKGTAYQYYKKASASGQPYHSVIFFIADHWVDEMGKQKRLKTKASANHSAAMLKLQHPLLGNFMQSVATYFETPIAWDQQMLELKTRELILNLEHIEPNFFQFLTTEKSGDKPDLLELMNTHALHRLTLEEYASLACRSVSTFKRDFQKAFNQPPAQWLRKQRLTEAYNRLQHSTIPVSEIGFELGFDDASNFSKAFKQEYGITPNSVRASKQLSVA